MRATTGDYTPPADACTSYQTLYQALAGFEADLHRHIHLENNLLFPRAIEIEEKAAPELRRPTDPLGGHRCLGH
jgi:regulator of cell morphogenesis and NO signaling